MMYLIGQLAGWLVLTAAFAGIAGWAFAAQRAAPAEASARRERNKLIRDLINIGAEERIPANGVSDELERQMDMLRRRAELDASRVTELERALETARARADEAQGHSAELQRALDRSVSDAPSAPQPVAELPAATVEPIDVEAEPAADDGALQIWRLRYFEQRVRYLENNARASAPAETPTAAAATDETESSNLEWRARTAEARVAHLEDELRAFTVATEGAPSEAPTRESESASPFAANADVDALVRWRLLYLERRAAHFQAQAAEPAPAVAESAPDPDRWKWRARYLEARVRHLEGRLQAPDAAEAMAAPAAARQSVAEEELETPAPVSSGPRGERPPTLSSPRNGAPDDLTLIDGVSLLQQTTLNALGVYHFDQIAAWTPAHVAWVDQYFRLRGRITEEEWIEQAHELEHEHEPATVAPY